MFKETILIDGKEFKDRSSLALYLKNNFRKSLNYLSDNSLYQSIQNADSALYETIINLSKDFQHKENILTLIIYLLDNTMGIVTPFHHFSNNHDIADVMKKNYPNINQDIKVLFQDKVLPNIYWNEYTKTNNTSYKRNYTFMLHVYENRMYEFTYYYYLFLHLSKNEVVRFSLDGLKMKSLAEITNHLANNIDRSQMIIDEILRNPFILALMAIQSGIDSIAATLVSKRKLEILKLLSTYSEVDLTPIIRRKMCYWLLINFKNYTYETEVAKVIYNEYQRLTSNLTLNNLSDYINIYDSVDELYKKFILLFDHNKLIKFRGGITSSDEYYLNYRYNEDYVCKKFLVDNDLYDETIHTEIHRDSVEREVIVDALEVEKQKVVKFREEVLTLTSDLVYDKKTLSGNLFISLMYIFLLLASLVGGLLLGLKEDNSTNQSIKYGVLAVLSISLVLLIVCALKYNNKLNDSDIVEFTVENSKKSIDTINKEAQMILNPKNKTFKHSSLMKLDIYSKNREKYLLKVKKISTKKTSVSSGLLIFASTLAIIPIIEFGLPCIAGLFDIIPFALYVNGYNFNIISLGLALINLVFAIIFRKTRFAYYLIYLYMIVLSVLGVLILGM